MTTSRLRLLALLTVAIALRSSLATLEAELQLTNGEKINVIQHDAGRSEPTADEHKRNVEANFKLPKMFQYERFKMLYHKLNHSAAEETLRLSIFLARSYQVFLSAVAYLYRLKSYYLKLGDRSDWLPQELDTNHNNLIEARDGERESEREQFGGSEQMVELVELDELEAELRRIKEHASEPNYAPLANELANLQVEQHERKKRSATSSTATNSHLPARIRTNFHITTAFSKPVEQAFDKISPIGHSTAKSNNPNWEQPEFDTRGLSDSSLEIDFIKLVEKEVRRGPRRTYDHLPVKGNYKTSGVVSWLTNNFLSNSLLGPSLQLASSWLSDSKVSKSLDENNGLDQEQLEDVVWHDHRQSGCLNPVGDQGKCSSCYAFTLVALLEWAHCLGNGGELVKFSEQYLIDCGLLTDNFLGGCRGGDITSGAEFVANYGLELAEHYPYSARDGTCPYHPKVERARMGFIRVGNLTQVLNVGLEYAESYLKLSPMAVIVDAGGSFAHYGGGVYDGKHCASHSADHLVLLIGHGREDGEEYWLMRNSYGVGWGEMGHMKLNKNSDCIRHRKGKIFKATLPNDIGLGLRRNEKRAD